MKVYVVLPWWEYEGYGEPELVTADKSVAENYIKTPVFSNYEIFEMELK